MQEKTSSEAEACRRAWIARRIATQQDSVIDHIEDIMDLIDAASYPCHSGWWNMHLNAAHSFKTPAGLHRQVFLSVIDHTKKLYES